MRKSVWWPLVALFVFVVSGSTGAEPITCRKLLLEMADLKQLSEYPAPAYLSKEATSHDRASVKPDDGATSDGWFANADCGMFIREETNSGRHEFVMMDAQGPGVIWRIWSANPEGTLRVYLDGSEKPAIAEKMEDLLGGKHPLLTPPLGAITSKGYALYFPIPYAKSCKVTSDAKDIYYTVAYRTYAAGTEIESLKFEEINSLSDELRVAAKKLDEPSSAVSTPPQVKAFESTFSEKSSKTVLEESGSEAFTTITLRVDPKTPAPALRKIVLKIRFDGQDCVRVPLPDFFAGGPGIHPYESLPVTVNASGEFTCRWYMPFKESAAIELENLGDQPVSISGKVGVDQHEWTDRSMHFHAGYHSQYDIPTRPFRDWNCLDASGKGVFVGLAMSIDNPMKLWWGEGDEKIYVDGEEFPSWFGTGSEDYFGYAWCDPQLFEHPYHNQTRCDGPGNFGRTCVNRFHIVDAIPFNKSLKFDIELWHHVKDTTINVATVAYWYALPGGADKLANLTVADVELRPILPYKAPRVAGAIEGESMKVLSKSSGTADPQNWARTSGEAQLWWRGNRKGSKLELEFPAEKDGKYRLKGRFLNAPDYGVVQVLVNDQSTGDPIDLYKSSVIVAREVDLGVYDLKAGANKLTLVIMGRNKQAVSGYMVGLDYIKAEPTTDPPSTRPSNGNATSMMESESSRAGDLRTGQWVNIYDPSVGENQQWYINDHCFIQDEGGTWHLFGITHAEPANALEEKQFAHATAPSLQGPWTKQPPALVADLEKFNEHHLWAPHVIRADGKYFMFFCAGGADHSTYEIHLATSDDLWNWKRHPANPLIVDGFDARDPMVIQVNDEWIMYYTGNSKPTGGNHVVFAVTSKDLVKWQDRRIVLDSKIVGKWGGPTESPFVQKLGSDFYLFCGAWQGYSLTRVFKSQDPFNFQLENCVGEVESHALEVVRDGDNWFVSHAGWDQGGVYLAPLKWPTR